MLSNELEFCLNEAFRSAREKRHEFMTVEHLMLALLDVPQVAEVVRACGGDIGGLRIELGRFIDENTPRLREDEENEVQPTLGFQRVLQRAVFHVQSSGKKEVTAINVLVAVFSEKQCHSTYLLQKQDITRLDVVNYISHGISAVSEEGGEGAETGQQRTSEKEPEQGGSPLELYATNLNDKARAGRVDPLIGRELEIERTIEILCRRRKNNPLYVGEVAETAALKTCLGRIEEPTRLAILLCYVTGLSHGEVAATLNAPLGTVKAWIRRGMAALQECLS